MTFSPFNNHIIYVIAGRTGAGKSTITDYISNAYGLQSLSFAEMGKQYSLQRGFNRLRDCYAALDRKKFKESISSFIYGYINNQLSESHSLVVDGLYAWDVVDKLRTDHTVVVIYLRASEDTRYDRISTRLRVSKAEAAKENALKEGIKKTLDSEKLISCADYIVDGNLALEMVKAKIDIIMSQFAKDNCSQY